MAKGLTFSKFGLKCGLIICFASGLAKALEPLPEKPPIPADNPMSAEKVELGKKLFFDPRLSKNGTISCASCHNVMAGGEDSRAVSVGVDGKKGNRSAQSVFNSGYLSVLFWDGRAKSLEEQAKGPFINPVEMAMPNHEAVEKRLMKIPGYVTDFKKVFKSEPTITIDNVAKAIAAYERTLNTPNSPFDKYLRGNKKAMSEQAMKGYKVFQEVGCIACHNGPALAGPALPAGRGYYHMFPQVAGLEFVKQKGLDKDLGRFEATKDENDKRMWRVPPLRNIALTAPYLHNGAIPSLREAVINITKAQLDKNLTDAEADDLVVFLESLTGEMPKQTMPQLPATPSNVVVEEIF